MSSPVGAPEKVPFPPFTRWRATNLEPEPAVFVTRDDRIYVAHRSALAVQLHLRARIQQPEDGRVVPQDWTISTVADRTQQLAILDGAEGWLLGFVIYSATAAMVEAGAFLEVGILRGGALYADRVQALAAGYVGFGDALYYPGGPYSGALAGDGRTVIITTADPAAGAEISQTVPAGAHWTLESARFSLVTAVAVANRRVHLVVDDGANVLLDTPAATVQAASLTYGYNAAHWGGPLTDVAPNLYLPLPWMLRLEPGWRVRTLTDLLQAADNFGPALLVVREYLAP